VNAGPANANATSERPSSTITYQSNPALLSDLWNPFNAAASFGNAAMLNSLIRKGARIDGDREYALQLAASEGHTEAVQTLLKHGALADRRVADSEELGFFDGTELQAACDNKRVEVVRCLLEHGANPNLGGGTFSSPIIAATQKAQPEILELLVRAPGIDLNVVGSDDLSTPLINAAANMSMSAVKLLIQHGAEIDAKNAAGDTALIMAAWRGDEDCVKLLCNEGADVTYRSPGRGLAIVAAASALHPSCATVLADKMGLNIETYREQGQSCSQFPSSIAADNRSKNRPFQRAFDRSSCPVGRLREDH
jgi:ankyrin repeat protein